MDDINKPTVEKFLEAKGVSESTVNNEVQAFNQAPDKAEWFKDLKSRYGGTKEKGQNKADHSSDTK